MEDNKSKTGDAPNYITRTSADDINYVNRDITGEPNNYQIPLVDTTASTSTSTFPQYGPEIIQSFEFKETEDGNFIEVVKRQKVEKNWSYSISLEPNLKDKIFKEIYGISTDDNGNRTLQLIRTIEGKINPAYHVEESCEFDE